MAAVTTRIVIHPDEGLIEKHFADGKVHKSAGSENGKGYFTTKVDRKMVRVHRLIWEHVHGPIPDGMKIDHVNGIRHDNRITNLRLVTAGQNNQNRHYAEINSTSGVKGVCWSRSSNKWSTEIRSDGRKFHLGYFATIEEAQTAYAGAAALLHTHNPHAAP